MAELESVEVRSRADLRAWLADHHARGDGVWLVFWKKHTDHYTPIGDLISELLCWGWVDAVTRGVDADRSSVRVAPRRATSAWSAVNKAKVDEARAAGLMTPAGEAAIARAQENGMWSFLDDVERLEVPADLAAALDAAGTTRAVWEAYPRSVKRGMLELIKTAKKAETRAKRIAALAEDAAAGLRPRNFR
ncbi:MAG: YdeI/OmpD-associated family protein [Pseudomonadota bacterium]